MSEPQLINKLVKAALEVGGKLKADKTNKDQNYNYVSADKILSICGQALFSQGIAVLPEISTNTMTTTDRGNGKARYDCIVDFIFKITDGETTLSEKWLGMGSDYMVPDKALYKAMTSGHKYFLMKLLCIGEGNEDGEHEGEDEDGKNKKAPAPGKATSPQSAPGNGKSAAAEKPWTSTVVTLETAKSEKSSDGVLYWDMDTAPLAVRVNSLNDTLKRGTRKVKGEEQPLTADERSEREYKRDLIQAILDYRQ